MEKKLGTVANCYQCPERERVAAGEAQMRRGPSLEQHGGLKMIGDDDRGLQIRRKSTGGLEHRQRKLEAWLYSWRLRGARTINGGTFCSWSGGSGLELAGEERMTAALTWSRGNQKANLMGGKAYRRRN